MINTCLQGQEYVMSSKRAGLYSHLLGYCQAVNQGLQPRPLPGEQAVQQQNNTQQVYYQQQQGQQAAQYILPQIQQRKAQPTQHTQQNTVIANYQPTQKNPVQVLAKRKASEKALTFFQSCLQVLGIEEEVEVTDELLRTAYKRVVVRAHPDRGGSEEHFEAVTRAYAYLTEVLHLIQGQKGRVAKPVQTLDSVKEQRQTQSQQLQYVEPVRLNPKNLNLNAFNQMFEQTRVPDPDEDGYGDWLKGEENTKLIKGKQGSAGAKFGKDFNRNVFNSMFEQEMGSQEENSQIALRNPEELTSYMNFGVELGRDRPPDYTTPINATMQFTDLKSAYTKENTFSGQVRGVQVENRSFDTYKAEREKGPAKYSDQEYAAINAWQHQQEAREKQRQLRAAQEQMTAAEYHERMKRLVLTDK